VGSSSRAIWEPQNRTATPLIARTRHVVSLPSPPLPFENLALHSPTLSSRATRIARQIRIRWCKFQLRLLTRTAIRAKLHLSLSLSLCVFFSSSSPGVIFSLGTRAFSHSRVSASAGFAFARPPRATARGPFIIISHANENRILGAPRCRITRRPVYTERHYDAVIPRYARRHSPLQSANMPTERGLIML